MTKFALFARWMTLCLLAAALAGCASDDAQFAVRAPEPGAGANPQAGQPPLQCAPYAREHSEVKIHGDAWTWWDQAAGKYPENFLPQPGAVMVLTNYAGPERAHVAVVRRIVSSREIRVDHANWLGDGAIYLNDPVEDVSPGNDWSQIRVYNIKTGGWGVKVYPVLGFIGGSEGEGRPSNRGPISDARAMPALVARADISKDSN